MQSFIFGVCACIIPSISVYRKIWFPKHAQDDAKKVVTNLFLTEFFKVGATITLLVVLLNSSSVNATSFIYGFLMAQSISWFVLKLILRLKA